MCLCVVDVEYILRLNIHFNYARSTFHHVHKEKIEDLKVPYNVETKMPLVTKLFKKRLKTAIRLASLRENSIVLDAGCHKGYLLKMIQNLGLIDLHGIDISPAILQPFLSCDLRRADVRNIPFPDSYFDVVFALDMLEHVDEIELAIKEINRVLKVNGFAVLSGPTESWFYKFCRFLWLGKLTTEAHKRSVYDIERVFQHSSFQLIEEKSLPGFPVPELFRISKFKKIA